MSYECDNFIVVRKSTSMRVARSVRVDLNLVVCCKFRPASMLNYEVGISNMPICWGMCLRIQHLRESCIFSCLDMKWALSAPETYLHWCWYDDLIFAMW